MRDFPRSAYQRDSPFRFATSLSSYETTVSKSESPAQSRRTASFTTRFTARNAWPKSVGGSWTAITSPSFRGPFWTRSIASTPGKGLFARSSTNAEDLPNFSGAGLYSTVPNVRSDDQLMEAIKTVWASVWNYEAYEARESFGMNHFGVYPAVLVQEGINADSAGVAITTDPFDRANRGAVYINAKRGLGMKVVEGRRVPEQVLFRSRTNTIQVLTRSDEDTMLAFDEQGGVKEMRIEQHRAVLTDEMIRRLARAALRIERVFGGRDQDIEWLYQAGKLHIVQSRPYIEGN